MKKAFITGITGQDGSYLAELLLGKGYAVHGLVRRTSMFNRRRIEHLREGKFEGEGTLELHYGELSDVTSLRRLLARVKPDEVYHLAGQSHIGLSFEIPEVTCSENGMGVLHLLEILRDLEFPVRVYLASSSEIFGVPTVEPQDENTPLNPANPYGCAKAFAVQLGRVYRESYGVHVTNGITYNHESPRRGENFVTRKISLSAARIAAGADEVLELGNLDGRRDWGYAPEYVEAMWRALQAERADDFVLATGETQSVREFSTAAFEELGIGLAFAGTGVAEIGRRTDNGKEIIRVNSHYFRPADAVHLRGDAGRAATGLEWKAATKGLAVAALMARADREALR